MDQELLPLWEFGLFNAATRMPHYRGSSEYDTYVIPFPYFIYRGDLLQVNRGGMRAVFLKTEHWDSDLSFSGNPPVRDDEARQGMPDLPALGEVGPAIRWLILPRGGARTLYLQASARASFSADWNGGPVMDYEGLHGDLRLSHSSTLAGRNPWRYGCSLGLDVADSSYNGYFYDVAEAYAQPGRPAYDSRAGYAGASLSAYVVKQFSESFSFATFAQWENVSGSVFEDSPLVREKNNLLVACALTWRLATSAQSVAAADPREE